MRFNSHSNLTGTHAFLSPSNHSWVNYGEDKLDQMFYASMAARRGTELHALAHDLIRLGVKLPSSTKTLNLYVNDAIGYKMATEQTLYYSNNCYGSPDAIKFNRNLLRIHDLKTGRVPASIEQLYVYAALFCLEYRYKPFDIKTELRIYQNDEVVVEPADADHIYHIIDRIVVFDKRINAIREEAL